MLNFRARLSDSAFSPLVLLALAATSCLFSATVVVWRNRVSEEAARVQRTADDVRASDERKSWEHQIADLNSALKRALQNRPQARIALGKLKLIANRRTSEIAVTVVLNNTGTAAAKNVASVLSLVFGAGNDEELVEIAKPPTIRLLASDARTSLLMIEINKHDHRKLATVLALIKRKQPITLTVNLYFNVDGDLQSRHWIVNYDYEQKNWQVQIDQAVAGFVPFPSSVFRGETHFLSEPYLPPPPTSRLCLGS